jgi:hypothetical protein
MMAQGRGSSLASLLEQSNSLIPKARTRHSPPLRFNALVLRGVFTDPSV